MNNFEFIATICTMIIGFLGVILTVITLNNSLRTDMDNKIDSLRLEFKADIARLESDIKELRGLILGLYNPRFNKEDKAA